MARDVHEEAIIIREAADKYITTKIRHHVKYFALESASKCAVWVIKSMDLREIVRTVSDEKLCKLFRVTGCEVHLCKQTYENTQVMAIAPILKKYGVILDKEKREGNYNEGEIQVADIFEWWMLVVVLAREFIVTGVRYMAATNNKVIAASKLGKAKTIAQYIAVIIVLLFGAVTKDSGPIHPILVYLSKTALFVMLILTILSGIDYVVKNKEVFYDKKGKNNF